MAQTIDRFADALTFQDPYDYYETLRQEAPIFYSDTLRAFVVSRFEDARAVALDDAQYSSAPPVNTKGVMASYSAAYHAMYAEAGLPPRIATVQSDGEVHQRYRKMLDPFLSPAYCKRIAPSVRSIISDLIDGFPESGAVDIYREFCLLVPLYIICEMMGLPKTDILLMQRAGDAATDLAGGTILSEEELRQRQTTIIEFSLYIREHINRVRNEPSDTLLSHLIHSPTHQGDHLTEQEILALAGIMNVGGNETTTNGLGNMIHFMLRDDRLEQRLRDNPAEIDAFIEETLRLESPVSSLIRWTTRDVEIGGMAIPNGSCIALRVPAANRDEHQFKCPAQIDLHRRGLRSHLAFGLGTHFCVGHYLARLEMRVAMEEILARLENLQLAQPEEKTVYAVKTHVRGVRQLPITFTRRQPHV